MKKFWPEALLQSIEAYFRMIHNVNEKVVGQRNRGKFKTQIVRLFIPQENRQGKYAASTANKNNIDNNITAAPGSLTRDSGYEDLSIINDNNNNNNNNNAFVNEAADIYDTYM